MLLLLPLEPEAQARVRALLRYVDGALLALVLHELVEPHLPRAPRLPDSLRLLDVGVKAGDVEHVHLLLRQPAEPTKLANLVDPGLHRLALAILLLGQAPAVGELERAEPPAARHLGSHHVLQQPAVPLVDGHNGEDLRRVADELGDVLLGRAHLAHALDGVPGVALNRAHYLLVHERAAAGRHPPRGGGADCRDGVVSRKTEALLQVELGGVSLGSLGGGSRLALHRPALHDHVGENLLGPSLAAALEHHDQLGVLGRGVARLGPRLRLGWARRRRAIGRRARGGLGTGGRNGGVVVGVPLSRARGDRVAGLGRRRAVLARARRGRGRRGRG